MADEGEQELQAEADVPLATPVLSITKSGLEIYNSWTARILVGVCSVGAAVFGYETQRLLKKDLIWPSICELQSKV